MIMGRNSRKNTDLTEKSLCKTTDKDRTKLMVRDKKRRSFWFDEKLTQEDKFEQKRAKSKMTIRQLIDSAK